jgi:hypothetical protein
VVTPHLLDEGDDEFAKSMACWSRGGQRSDEREVREAEAEEEREAETALRGGRVAGRRRGGAG